MKRYRYGLFFLTVILGAFALYRCFAERARITKNRNRCASALLFTETTIRLSIQSAVFWKQKQKKYEKTEGIRMILDVMDAKEDQNTQNSQVDRFLALGCDVICVNMVDRSAASVIIDKAMDREVPVNFF